MLQQTCASDDELRAWLLGRLDDQSSDRIAAHLADCSRCEHTLSAFDESTDSMVRDLKQAAIARRDTAADPQPSDDLQSVLQQVRNPWENTTEATELSAVDDCLRDYELREPLGSGGMGTVYRAIHRRLRRTVAIKLLPARRLRDQAAVTRFEREMQAIGSLNHPAIVRATDAGEVDGTHFLAMDFVHGIDLGQLVRRTGPLSVADACEVIRQAALGLQHAHDRGLVHRDIKPSNLMIELPEAEGDAPSPCDSDGTHGAAPERSSDSRDDGRPGASHAAPTTAPATEEPSANSGRAPFPAASVKILDLGLALFGSASEAVDDLTTVGQLMGTLDYMAPEQADNCHHVDARADIYSLGATLFKLLTGRAPYESPDVRSPLRKMKAIATIDAPAIQSRNPAIPDAVAAIVDRTLSRDPAARFATAAEVAEALAPFCLGHQIGRAAQRAMAAVPPETPARRSGPLTLERSPDRSESPTGPRPADPSASGAANAASTRAAGSAQPPRSRWRILRALAAGALLVLAGVIIWIRTDRGTLKIESADDDIPIEIRQGESVVEELTLETGANHVTLRSGRYELVLQTPYDGLSVDRKTVEIQRGGEAVVRVQDDADEIAGSAVALPADRAITAPPLESFLESVPKFSDPRDAIRFSVVSQRYYSLLSQQADLDRRVRRMADTYHSDHPRMQALSTERNAISTELQGLSFQLEHLAEDARAVTERQEQERRLQEVRQREWEREQRTQATYEGQTYKEWAQVLTTERSPDRLKDAVMALCILSRGEREQEAAQLVFDVIRPFPCTVGRDSPESRLVTTAIRYLRGMDPVELTPVLIEELDTLQGRSATHIFDGLLNTAAGHRSPDLPQVETGSPARLISYLEQSPDFRAAVIGNFFDLSTALQFEAWDWLPEYQSIPGLDGELQQLFNRIVADGDESIRALAARQLAFIEPRAELVPPLLQRLQLSAEHQRTLTPDELFTWHAVLALREHLAEFTEAIRGFPRGERTQSPFLRSSVWDDEQAVSFRLPDADLSQPAAGDLAHVSRRLLQVELLAAAGVNSAEVTELLASELERLAGCRPVDDGDYEFAPGRRHLLLEAPLASPADAGRSHFSSARSPRGTSIPAVAGFVARLNSALVAWERLTGETPQFDQPQLRLTLGASRGRDRDIALSETEHGPLPARFRGRSLDEWIAAPAAELNSLDELQRVHQAVDWLVCTPTHRTAAFPAMRDVLQQMIRVCGQSESLRQAVAESAGDFTLQPAGGPIHAVLEWTRAVDPDATRAALVTLFDEGDDFAQTFVLREIAVPGPAPNEDQAALYLTWSDLAERLRSGPQAEARFRSVQDQWATASPELQQAVLRWLTAAPDLQDAGSQSLLEMLLTRDDASHRAGAAIALSRKTDLPKELHAPITEQLLTAALESDDIATVVNCVASLPLVYPDHLPDAALTRIIDAIAEADDRGRQGRLLVDHHGDARPTVLIVSRRILLADLLADQRPLPDELAERAEARLRSLVEESPAGRVVEQPPVRSLVSAAKRFALFGAGQPVDTDAESRRFSRIVADALGR